MTISPPKPPPPKASATAPMRKPPADFASEQALLGSVILMSEALDDVALLIDAADFSDDAHRKIYEHCLAMHESGRRFDEVLFINRLKAAGDYEAVGGAAYITKLINCVPHAGHATYYAEIVRATATRRGMLLAASKIMQDAYDDGSEITEYVAQSEAAIFAAANRCQKHTPTISVTESVMQALESLDRRIGGQAMRGVSSGLHGLDHVTGGFQPGEVTVLAGRTSMGKTALAINISRHVANESPVLLFSLEMDALSISERLLASESGTNVDRMRDGTISHESRQRLVEAAETLGNLKMRIDDTSSRTVAQIASICRREFRKGGLGLVVIDYLQLIEPDNYKEPRHEQVAKISRRLKALARELKVPLVVLAQLNRQATTSKDNRPALSHLRESGAIEQDADVVLFCHRPAYYEFQKSTGTASEKAELIVAKNRQGPTASIDVLWFGSSMTFKNVAEQRFDADNEPKRISAFDAYNEQQEQEWSQRD